MRQIRKSTALLAGAALAVIMAAVFVSHDKLTSLQIEYQKMSAAVAPAKDGQQLKLWTGSKWVVVKVGNPGEVLSIVDDKPVWSADQTASAVTQLSQSVAADNLITCSTGQILRASNGGWVCSAYPTNLTGQSAATATAGGSSTTVVQQITNVTETIPLTDNSVTSLAIADGDVAFSDLATNGCSAGQVMKFNGTAWTCGVDNSGLQSTSFILTDGVTPTPIATGDTLQLSGSAAVSVVANGTGGVNFDILTGSISTAKLADNAVNSAKIADGTVTNTDLVNNATTVTAGNGLAGGGAAVLGSAVALNVDGSTTSTTATTASNSGIEATADGIRLLGGCGDTQILKWSLGDGGNWQCAADQLGSVAANSLDFAELKDTMALDATTTINMGANDFVYNLDGSGDYKISDNGTAVLTISDDSKVVFKNSTDSTGAFTIQKANSTTNLFVADTASDRIYIGDIVADDVGSLLVLDTKTAATDPTGTNGAMYYNSGQSKFRCYAAGAWGDCGTPTARTTYYYSNELMGVVADTTTSSQVSGGTNSATTVSGVAGHPGVVQSSTGVTATGRAAYASTSFVQLLVGNGVEYVYDTDVRVNALSTGTETFTYRTGFIDSVSAESVDGCFLRYSHAINGANWQGVCRSNSVESVCDTGIAVSAASWVRLTVAVNTAGSTADFLTNGASRCQVTTNIPVAASRSTGFGSFLIKSVGTTARTVDVDYLEVTGKLATSR